MKIHQTIGTVTHIQSNWDFKMKKRAGKNSALLSIKINRLLNSEIETLFKGLFFLL